MEAKKRKWFEQELSEGKKLVQLNKEQLLWVIWHERSEKLNFALMMILSLLLGIVITISIMQAIL